MPMTIGTRLGPYEILSAIGAGGMGEVYKARDTRLNRIVAIKVLPTHLADQPELKDRFKREAETIASLNHPHICTLHDIGNQDGTDYLVMEYLEGETLATRLLKGPLPLDQVLRYAIEIADALDKAQRKGVTHRDIKPGNIMLTKNGSVLLDFGLAKMKLAATPAATPVSQLPTLSHNPTVQGSLLGTIQYMAPEQVEGKTDQIDARTDIFAFGVVVYEMATGKKAFEGKSQASLIAAILEREPPAMSSLQPMTPPALDRVVKKCLAKEPDKRWQTTSDLTDELTWIAEAGSQAALTVALPLIRKDRRRMILWAALSVAACTVVGLAAWSLRPTPQPQVTRFTISLPTGQRLIGSNGPTIAISPDGTRLVYVANRIDGPELLYLRSMDTPEAKPVPGTEGATTPFFSPDSQWLGFFADGKLKKIAVIGEVPVTLCDAATAVYRGATWGADDTIIFNSPVAGAGLLQVSAFGGTAKLLDTMDSKKGDATNLWPEFLPGGKAVLFAAASNPNNVSNTAHIVVSSLQSGFRKDLIPGTRPKYSTTEHLIYTQAGNLMAVPFDMKRLAASGSPIPVIENVWQSAISGAAQYSFSNTGTLIYLTGGVQGVERTLVWTDRKGVEQPLAAPSHAYRTPRISPDGRRVAIAGVDADIWLYDLSRDTLTRLTFQGGVVPVWSPDGNHVTFGSSAVKGSNTDVFWQPSDGSGSAEPLTTFDGNQRNIGSWSPDGQLLAFEEVSPTTNRDVWIFSLRDRKAQPFLNTPFNETAPEFSPDGHWLAYASDESGRYEIYVQPYPGPGGKWQISTDGGTEPRWARDGELFFRSGDKMMAVPTTLKPSFSDEKPKVLFEGHYVPTLATMANYDVTPDGQRFLMVKASDQDTSVTQINVVLNWFEELKQKAPTGKK